MRRVTAVALGVLVLNVVTTFVAVALNLPTQFGYEGRDAGSEWVGRGTAISAPLVPLVVFAAATALSVRRDRWGAFGVVVIALVAIVFTIGAAGEALADATPDVPKWVLVTSGAVGVALSIATFVAAVADLRARRRMSVAS